jgi:hypothetical protein
MVMFPVITGATGQERICDGYPDVALDMVGRTFDGQIQLVEYLPRVLHGQAGTSGESVFHVIVPTDDHGDATTRRDDSGSTGGAITLAALAAV